MMFRVILSGVQVEIDGEQQAQLVEAIKDKEKRWTAFPVQGQIIIIPANVVAIQQLVG